ncbi:MAG: hypothetical protein HY047_13500 [Acidobacteria bacterium]|nr:hypothetical protein [Acidobacteriota bacterium]
MNRRLSLVHRRLALSAAALVVVSALSLMPSARAAGLARQSAGGAKAASVNGLWDATIVAGDATVPFRFEIATTGADVQGFFFEGDQKVGSSEGTFADGVLKLVYDHLNTTLELKLSGDTLTGTYVNNRPNARPQDVQMRRFTPVIADTTAVLQATGTWEMRRLAEEVSAPRDTRTWHVFLRQSGAEVAGSILRVDGDTGALVGRWTNGKLTLSHFAGERPNLFEATPNPDGTLNVTLNGNAHYLVVRSSEARAKGIPEPPDPSRYTSVKDPTTHDAEHRREAATDRQLRRVSDVDLSRARRPRPQRSRRIREPGHGRRAHAAEDRTARAHRAAARGKRAEFDGTAIIEHGAAISSIAAASSRSPERLALRLPSHQPPAGGFMPSHVSRRQFLADRQEERRGAREAARAPLQERLERYSRRENLHADVAGPLRWLDDVLDQGSAEGERPEGADG